MNIQAGLAQASAWRGERAVVEERYFWVE